METLVSLIRPENFEREVVWEKKPVLLLCMPRDEEFPNQLKVVEDIARKYWKELRVGVLEEGFIEAIQKKLQCCWDPNLFAPGRRQRESPDVRAC